MAVLKLNRLHLHLTDAAGWRVEIDRYPLLTSLAAWREGDLWKDWWFGERKYLPEGTGNTFPRVHPGHTEGIIPRNSCGNWCGMPLTAMLRLCRR